MSSILDPRQILRKQLRQARKNLSDDEQLHAAQSLRKSFDQFFSPILDKQQPIKRVALYLSNDGEISPHLLCEYFWEQEIQTYLPVIQDKKLTFALYTADTTWQQNDFNINEPVTTKHIPEDNLDIVFLPLVGFDKEGGRLGMGGGFYDRTFASKKVYKKPLLIGLAHDCQQVSSLPVENWDVPLQAIITPTQVIDV